MSEERTASEILSANRAVLAEAERIKAESTVTLVDWQRPAWATESTWDNPSEVVSELTVLVGFAQAEATCCDEMVVDTDSGRSSIERTIFVRVWNSDTSETWYPDLGPFSLNQARTLTEADLPGAKPGFAESALQAVAQLLARIDAADGNPAQDRVPDREPSPADVEAAATPTGPCPPWCDQPAGHPWDSGAAPGEQMRWHFGRLSEHTRLVASEKYVDGVWQPVDKPGIDVDTPDGDLCLMALEDADRLGDEIGLAALRAKNLLAEIAGTRSSPAEIAERRQAAEAEAAATTVGPCPAWCEMGAGHLFEAGNDPGFQYRKHERLFGEFVSIWSEEQFLDGVAQPPMDAKISVYVPDDESDVGLADASALARDLAGALAALSGIDSPRSPKNYDITDGPTVTDEAGGIHPAWCERLGDPNHLGPDRVDPPCISYEGGSVPSVSTWIDNDGERQAGLNIDYDEIPLTGVWEFIADILAAAAIFDPPAVDDSDSGVQS